MKQLTCVFLCILIIFASCNKDNEIPSPTNSSTIKYLGHRGSGSDDFIGKDSLFPPENTFQAMLIGFQYLNGSETDIQMSLDGTIWLWHDHNFPNTSSNLSIPELHDTTILRLQPINKPLAKLDSVLYWMSKYAYTKYISLDVKGYFPYIPNLDYFVYFNRMTDSISAMVRRYHIERRVFVETDYTMFLDFMKIKEPLVDRYLLAYTDLRSAINTCIDREYTGISFAYYDTSLTEQNIKYLHSKGLKIQVWTLHSIESIEQIKNLYPDVIQTDIIKEISLTK
ncbi:MAG: glycerophosphodiester phosphodiesterase [Bacteroidales bacterium]|nr:glycerophosphodiester phosphodiesterase [Bacteroidales bacterium]